MKSLFAPFIALCLILAGVCVCFPQCGAGNFIPPENAPTDSFVSPNTGLKSWIYDDIEITAGFAPLNFDYEVTMPAPIAYKDNGIDYHDTISSAHGGIRLPTIAFIGYVMPDYIQPAIRLK